MTICHSGPDVAITQLSPKWSGFDSGLKVECGVKFYFSILVLEAIFVLFFFPSCEFLPVINSLHTKNDKL